MAQSKRNRPDKDGPQRAEAEKNRKKILATQSVCGICGKPVDKILKSPDPLSACVDHIVPIAKGGHPSDIQNMQLAHRCCNREKADKIIRPRDKQEDEVLSNRILPQSRDWTTYRSTK